MVAASSPESALSFKVHVKQLNEQDLEKMDAAQLELVQRDLYSHEDLEYRQKMLVGISKLQLARGDVLAAAKTAVAAKDVAHQAWFISQFVEVGKDELAV